VDGDSMLLSHRNPIKRNQNIGTKKSGYKKQSSFDIPFQNWKPFYENLKIQEQCQREVNGKTFTFIVEKLKSNYIYACSIDEICKVLSYCPSEDLEGLSLVILRQPKKKEEILSPCWGRLIYEFNYQAKLQPAIIIESIDINEDIIIKGTDVSPFLQKEIEQLKNEGHEIKITNKKIIIKNTMQSVKNTQLYRTVLHEVGHYVFKKRGYNINNHEEKETFANTYAKNIKKLMPATY